jgi:peroxin-5
MSERALEHYGKAISMKPRFPRAWLNMAISYSNLKEYDEASRCYLQTLALNEGATQCWSYLRLSITCAERWELLEAATKHDLKPFEQVFDFVREKTA